MATHVFIHDGGSNPGELLPPRFRERVKDQVKENRRGEPGPGGAPGAPDATPSPSDSGQ